MRALVAPGPGRLVMDEVPDPVPQPGQVLIRTRVTAVSAGTELRMLYRGQDGRSGGPGWPAVGAFGYLASGDVLEAGAGVTGVAAGDRVACGTGWGAHRELLVADAASVHVLPPGLTYLDGACAYWAVPPLCGILAGRPDFYDDVAVVGLGPLGLAAAQMLVPFCRRVIATDRLPARRDVAEAFGAVTVCGTADEVRAGVERVSPELPAVVIQAAGAADALDLALRIVRGQGVVVNVGTLPKLDGFDLCSTWSGAAGSTCGGCAAGCCRRRTLPGPWRSAESTRTGHWGSPSPGIRARWPARTGSKRRSVRLCRADSQARLHSSLLRKEGWSE
jgi:threonine dehydrogenase-like Zn-dependent dehydrogenase